jgi:hypothetical protein
MNNVIIQFPRVPLWTHADRDGMALVDLGLEWKQQFQEKGWSAP